MSAALKFQNPSPEAAFVVPPWDEPLDPEPYLRLVPHDMTVRGMYFSGILREWASKEPALAAAKNYRAFHSYPMREFMTLMLDICRSLYPDVSLRQGLRQLGWVAFRDFVDSTIGKVILGAINNDPRAIYALASKIYGVSVTRARVTVTESGTHHTIVAFDEVYNFIDCYHVGAFEGVLRLLHKEGDVKIDRSGLSTARLLVKWA